jgi:hypothetical protein
MKRLKKTSEKVLVSFQNKRDCIFYSNHYNGNTTLGSLREIGTIKRKVPVICISLQNIQYLQSVTFYKNVLDILFEFNFTIKKSEDEAIEIFCYLAYGIERQISKKQVEIMEIFHSEEICIGLGKKYNPKSAKFCFGWTPCKNSVSFTIEDKRPLTLTNALTVNQIFDRTNKMSTVINDIFLDLYSEFQDDVQFFPNPYHSKLISTLRNINLNQIKN